MPTRTAPDQLLLYSTSLLLVGTSTAILGSDLRLVERLADRPAGRGAARAAEAPRRAERTAENFMLERGGKGSGQRGQGWLVDWRGCYETGRQESADALVLLYLRARMGSLASHAMVLVDALLAESSYFLIRTCDV